MDDDARNEWLKSNRRFLAPSEHGEAKIFHPGYMLNEAQIATLYNGRSYEDKTNIRSSNGRPLRSPR